MPVEAHRDGFGAEKVLVAESRIFTKGDGLCDERRSGPEREIVIAYFYVTAKDGFESVSEFLLEAGVVDEKRDGHAAKPDEKDERRYVQRPTQPGPARRFRVGGASACGDGDCFCHGYTVSQKEKFRAGREMFGWRDMAGAPQSAFVSFSVDWAGWPPFVF